ncbi:MAG: cytochrome C oxidase subunit IV family protein [Acidobacteria bacterium]|nr:cytochrome C oxidase subunit IV family protein [Acidobacteriota bacterium]MBS1867193.1 cytochrome C oxidase subunit IV family protein [Acidobacteriota bacterium]
MSENGHQEHVVSPKLYATILAALLFGTWLTVQAAKIDLGRWNIVLALLIATIKMSLVILFFMHGKYSSRRTQLVIVSGFFWLAIMLGLTMTDYSTRKPEPSRSANPPAIAIHRA